MKNLFVDDKSVLAVELYVQWDTGFMKIICMEPMLGISKLSVTQGANYFYVDSDRANFCVVVQQCDSTTPVGMETLNLEVRHYLQYQCRNLSHLSPAWCKVSCVAFSILQLWGKLCMLVQSDHPYQDNYCFMNHRYELAISTIPVFHGIAQVFMAESLYCFEHVACYCRMKSLLAIEVAYCLLPDCSNSTWFKSIRFPVHCYVPWNLRFLEWTNKYWVLLDATIHGATSRSVLVVM
jgi:hypothetical protein